MSLNQNFLTMLTCLIIGVVVLLFTDSTLATAIGIGLIVIGAVIDFAGMRCLHCKAWIGNNPGKRCKGCGREIDFRAKK